jgi:adenosylmethionine-8-amino-7-oxononanoate aminotransferase
VSTRKPALWRGFTDMAATAGREVVIVGGEGSTVWDREGRRYLDGSASLWYCNVGHGRAEIADAAAAQMRRLEAFHGFGVFANEPALELAERVAALSQLGEAAVFLTPGGGSDAVDSAGKIARRYWSALDRPGKTVLVSREHAYHGMNAYGTSLAGIPANRAGFGQLVPDVLSVPWDSVDAVEQLLERDAERIAAFVGEPVIGAGGVIPPPPGYWPAIQELCRAHDVLLVCDEVICGFGRLGRMFGAHRYGIEPDLMTCAKGLTSGYLPLGAVIAAPRVKEPFFERGREPVPFRHGYTYGAHPTCCAAALANIDILERERLVERVAELEPVLDRELRAACEGLPLVAEVRTAGLLGGVELSAQAIAAEPGLAERTAAAALEHGLVTRALRGVALQLSPPFVVSEGELREMAQRLAAAIDAVSADVAA